MQSIIGSENILDKSPDIEIINLEMENTQALKKEVKSRFLPELSIKTGTGSNKEIDEAKKVGNFLYLDGKLNLFNGFIDQKSYQIAAKKDELNQNKKSFTENKILVEIYSKLKERELLILNQELLKKEDVEIRKLEKLAQKKNLAGLTTQSYLSEFEFKENQIDNDVKLNEIKIAEIELEIKKITGLSQVNYSELLKSFKTEAETQIKASPSKNMRDLEESILELEVAKNKSAHLPTLDFEFKSGQINLQKKLFKKETEHEALLTLSFPLFSGGSIQSSVTTAKTELEILKRKNMQDMVEFENQLLLTRQKLNINREILVKTEASLKKSIDLEAVSFNEFKRGIKESSDLIASIERTFELKRKINEINFEIQTSTYFLNKIY